MASKLQLAGFLFVLGLGATTAAEPEVMLTVMPGQGTVVPQIEALVHGAPRIPVGKITLRDPRGVEVPASEVIEFRDSKRTMGLAVVFNGQEVWVGNNDIEPEDSPARYYGSLDGIRRGLDAMDLARTLPAGSKATLISYAEKAEIRFPMSLASGLTGAAVGTQKDYYSKIGTSLVEGTALALTELEMVRTDTKLLIIVGDGNDTNPEAARLQFAELKKRAAQDGIQIVSIIYKGVLSEPSNAVTTLAPRSITVASADGIVEQMQEAVRRATSDYTVRFSGDRLRWDGLDQELTLQFDRDAIEPISVKMGNAPTPRAETPWFLRWWAQLAAGLLLVGAIVGAARLRGRSAI